MRAFDGGAIRDEADHKLDFEGFLSPLALERFAEYMHKHRETAHGLRSSDNWQNGFPLDVYMKSAWRHFFDWWKLHRGLPVAAEDGSPLDVDEALCALLFNVMGYLHETLRP